MQLRPSTKLSNNFTVHALTILYIHLLCIFVVFLNLYSFIYFQKYSCPRVYMAVKYGEGFSPTTPVKFILILSKVKSNNCHY